MAVVVVATAAAYAELLVAVSGTVMAAEPSATACMFVDWLGARQLAASGDAHSTVASDHCDAAQPC